MNDRERPLALRLAEYLDLPHLGQHKSAAELRRLHEVNTELLAALEQIETATACAFSRNIARAAITKAEGENS